MTWWGLKLAGALVWFIFGLSVAWVSLTHIGYFTWLGF